MVPAEFQFRESDFLEAVALHGRWGVKSWLLWSIGTGVFFIGGLIFFFSSNIPKILGIIWICCAAWTWAVLGVTKFVLTPIFARKRFKQRRAFQRPQAMSWDENAFSVKSVTGETHTPWSDFIKWRENGNLFLIYVTPRLFLMVPKRICSDQNDVAGLRRLLQDRIGPDNTLRKTMNTNDSAETVS